MKELEDKMDNLSADFAAQSLREMELKEQVSWYIVQSRRLGDMGGLRKGVSIIGLDHFHLLSVKLAMFNLSLDI